MNTPRAPGTSVGSRTPRTARRAPQTPHTPGRAPVTARPSGPTSSAEPTPRSAVKQRGSVFDRLTTGIAPSAASRYIPVHSSRKISWTPRSPTRQATVSCAEPTASTEAKPAQPTPQTARPRQPLYTPPLPASHYQHRRSQPLTSTAKNTLDAQPSQLGLSHKDGRNNNRVASSQHVKGLVSGDRQYSPDPSPPPSHETHLEPRVAEDKAGAVADSAAPTADAKTVAVESLPCSPRQEASPQPRTTKIVRKEPPQRVVASLAREPPRRAPDDAEGPAATDSKATPHTNSGTARPASAVPDSPLLAQSRPVPLAGAHPAADEGSVVLSVSIRSQSPHFFFVESPIGSRPLPSPPATSPARAPVSVPEETHQIYALLDADGDGVVSADDVYSFCFLHADSLLSVTGHHLESLLDASLCEDDDSSTASTTTLRSALSQWRRDATPVTIEDAVSAVLLLATHVDSGNAIREDCIERALERFLHFSTTAPAKAAPDPARSAEIGRCSEERREHARVRRMSCASTRGGESVTDAEGVLRQAPNSPCPESHESVISLSVGSWGAESTRALLRSIQFREITCVPAHMTLTALAQLMQAGRSLTTASSVVYARRCDLVAQVRAQLRQAQDIGFALTHLSEALAVPLLLHGLVRHLETLDACQHDLRSEQLPLASPLRPVAWRLVFCAAATHHVGIASQGTTEATSHWREWSYGVMRWFGDLVLTLMCYMCRWGGVTMTEAYTQSHTGAGLQSASSPTFRRGQFPRHAVPLCEAGVVSSRALAAIPRVLELADKHSAEFLFQALSRSVSAANAPALAVCVPYLCVFRSASDVDRLALFFASRPCLPQTAAPSWMTNHRVAGFVAVLAACVVGWAAARLWLVYCLMWLLALLWHSRRHWRAALAALWVLSPYYAAVEDGSASPEMCARRLVSLHGKRRTALWAQAVPFRLTWPLQRSMPSPATLALQLTQQSEWWLLDALPYFGLPTDHSVPNMDDAHSAAKGRSEASRIRCRHLYHTPMSVYLGLAVAYALQRTALPSTEHTCANGQDILWRCLNSLILVPTLKLNSASTLPAEAPLSKGMNATLEEVDVLSDARFQRTRAAAVDLVKRTLANPASLTNATAQQAFAESVHALFDSERASALPQIDISEQMSWAALDTESPLSTAFRTLLADSDAVCVTAALDIRPFRFQCLWRRDQRECVALFACALFLFSPTAAVKTASDLQYHAEFLRLLIAASLVASVPRVGMTDRSRHWADVQQACAQLKTVRRDMLACLARGEPLEAHAVVSAQSILSRCLPGTPWETDSW